MEFEHASVLLDEVVDVLRPGPGKLIVDVTLGGGGHAEALLDRQATVVGMDKDPAALAAARERLGRFGARFRAVQGDFASIEALLGEGIACDGLIADLGVSSHQLDAAERGFSFQVDGPLDMRMGTDGETAAELIARVDEVELASLIRAYGEEPHSRRVARELKAALPQRTGEAVEAIKRAIPRRDWPERTHVATRTFQALRIAVNRELESLDQLLGALPRVLKPGGVAAIITFHSLEDREVKQRFRELSGSCRCPPGLPICACGAVARFRILSRKGIGPSPAEVARNPRARSARLRAVERLP